MRPIWLALISVNHRLPSGPAAMSQGLLCAVGIGNSVMVGSGDIVASSDRRGTPRRVAAWVAAMGDSPRARTSTGASAVKAVGPRLLVGRLTPAQPTPPPSIHRPQAIGVAPPCLARAGSVYLARRTEVQEIHILSPAGRPTRGLASDILPSRGQSRLPFASRAAGLPRLPTQSSIWRI